MCAFGGSEKKSIETVLMSVVFHVLKCFGQDLVFVQSAATIRKVLYVQPEPETASPVCQPTAERPCTPTKNTSVKPGTMTEG